MDKIKIINLKLKNILGIILEKEEKKFNNNDLDFYKDLNSLYNELLEISQIDTKKKLLIAKEIAKEHYYNTLDIDLNSALIPLINRLGDEIKRFIKNFEINKIIKTDELYLLLLELTIILKILERKI